MLMRKPEIFLLLTWTSLEHTEWEIGSELSKTTNSSDGISLRKSWREQL